MSNLPGRQIKRHTGSFRYLNKIISFNFWSHLHIGERPDTIIFLGTGQTGRIVQWAAQAAPSGVVVVEGAPHWHADPNALDLYDFMYLYTLAAFQVVLDEFALTSAHLVAQSQAAPGVVKLGIICSDKANNIVLIAPLGFAATIFGNTAEIRVRTLLRRAGQTFLQLSQSPFYDPRNIYVGLMMLQAIVLEPKRGASKRKYAAGLAYDMRDDYYRLMKLQEIKGKTVTLLLGGEDKVFREEEIRPLVEALDMKSLKIQVLPGVSHLSLGVRGGNKVLKAAVDIVRK